MAMVGTEEDSEVGERAPRNQPCRNDFFFVVLFPLFFGFFLALLKVGARSSASDPRARNSALRLLTHYVAFVQVRLWATRASKFVIPIANDARWTVGYMPSLKTPAPPVS
jgi:hypothetical protein